ncbi:MAG: hypothetical protein V2A54_08470 [Bacteroidota bacterium]
MPDAPTADEVGQGNGKVRRPETEMERQMMKDRKAIDNCKLKIENNFLSLLHATRHSHILAQPL